MSPALALDASAAVELLSAPTSGAASAHRVIDPALAVHGRQWLIVEVAQVLRRIVISGRMTPARGATALADLVDLDVQRHDDESLLPRVWQLPDIATAYDALSLALAEVLDAPLVILEAPLGRAPGHEAVVEVLGAAGQPSPVLCRHSWQVFQSPAARRW